MTKLLGKRQLAQLTIFEYITGIVLGGIVAIHTSTMKYTFADALISMIIWFVITFTVEQLSLRNKFMHNFFLEKNAILIQNNKMMVDNVKKKRFTTGE